MRENSLRAFFFFLVSGTTKMSSRGLALLFSKLGYRSGFRARSRTFRRPCESEGSVSAGSVFFRETRHGGTMDPFRFSGDDGATIVAAVNGNPFGDVNAKFLHSTVAALSRTLIIKRVCSYTAITATAATSSKCARTV